MFPAERLDWSRSIDLTCRGNSMERVSCLGDHAGIRLSNGDAHIVATIDVGPRIVEYSRTDGDNVLGEARDVVIETELGSWRPYGGHRLWAAPEANPRSYAPDNEPVVVHELGELAVRLVAPRESGTGLQKSITIALDDTGSEATIIHSISNRGMWDVELAAWALTIVGAGGEAIIPGEPSSSHADNLLPVRSIALWGYTDLTDSRLKFGRYATRIRSDAAKMSPFKIGASNSLRWVAWHRDGILFVKEFAYVSGAEYPDRGCNVEVYTAGDFMEIESLSPLMRLAPGATIEHLESWSLFDIGAVASDEELLSEIRRCNPRLVESIT